MPPGTSAQSAELLVLTRALELSKKRSVGIYTDFKYAFFVLHAHSTIFNEKQFFTASGSPNILRKSLNILRRSLSYFSLAIYFERSQLHTVRNIKGDLMKSPRETGKRTKQPKRQQN